MGIPILNERDGFFGLFLYEGTFTLTSLVLEYGGKKGKPF